MLELPWVAFFVLAGPWFWLLAVAAMCFIIWALEEDSGVWATTTLVAFLLLITFFGEGLVVFKWLAANPWMLLWGALAYIGIGAVWGVIKWYFYASSKAEDFEDLKIAWLKSKGVAGKKVPLELQNEWTAYVCDNGRFGHWEYLDPNDEYYGSTNRYTPKDQRKRKPMLDMPYSWNNKARIVRWMSYWPFSMLWSLLDDVVKRIFRRIQRMLGQIMDSITERVWRSHTADFGITTPETPETSEKMEDESAEK
jgi:hypothetical protein